jgi:3-hydroxymyristoyl/3-hydroxydecanoyl-(acyl carrier protein) dehydratase
MPYDPDVLLFDRILSCDSELDQVRCRWTTSREQPITRSQRNHPARHPAHVSGALMVHASGMLGWIHAYHLLGLRHHEGWIGYGTHMDKVQFRKLVPPGEIIEATCTAKRKRIGQVRHFVRYVFEFRHDGDLCYQSEQSAMWMRIDEDHSAIQTALL